jgi:hypothetical protein
MAVANFPKAIDRTQDPFTFKGQLLDILNDMLKYKSNYEIPETSFIFGGYSWMTSNFVLWNIYYDKYHKICTYRRINPWRNTDAEIKVFLPYN